MHDSSIDHDATFASASRHRAESPPVPDARPFKPDLDLAELSDRNTPGPAWSGRGEALSRSHLILRSRAMCYLGRRLLVVVHLIDAEPVLLSGKVLACEYLGECLHRTILELEPTPRDSKLNEWLHAQSPKRR